MWNISKFILRRVTPCRRSNFYTSSQLMQKNLSNDSKDKKQKALIYKNEGVFHSKTLLAKQLQDNIVFDDSKSTGLIVVNKPFGLPLLPGSTQQHCRPPEEENQLVCCAESHQREGVPRSQHLQEEPRRLEQNHQQPIPR